MAGKRLKKWVVVKEDGRLLIYYVRAPGVRRGASLDSISGTPAD